MKPGRRRGWIVLGAIVIVGFVIGVLRDGGPRSAHERANLIAQQVACPVCNGESAYESQVAASVNIRNEIAKLVAAGQLSDDQIIATIEQRFPGTALIPKGSGVEALIWAIPTAFGVLALGGVGLAMRRWRSSSPAAPGNLAAWVGGIVVVAALAGWAVAANVGQRSDGATAGPAGTVPSDPVQAKLAEARAQLGSNPSAAADAYLAVLKIDPTNVEAMTYSAWLVVQQGQSTGNQELVKVGIAALKSAAGTDPAYPDAHCFVAIASARFLTAPDTATARAEAQACLDNGVSDDMRPLVEGLLASVSTTPDSATPGSATPGSAG